MSRARKLPRYEGDTEALERQLNNDFQVYTYLQAHALDRNNTDLYAQLLNSLVLTRRNRSQHLLKLKNTLPLPPEPNCGDATAQFEAIEEKTGKEEEVKNNLQREINQTKKSLNLLKGDIGHLVSRNQSAQLLGSKVNKAKIVAQDQLKRVTLALVKDKDQIKIRNQMQKKFGKKLQNVESFETNGLIRAKKYYAEGQIRKQDVYQKLLSSQKTAQNGEQMAVLLTVKEKLDAKNRTDKLSLLQLAAVTGNFSLKKCQLPRDVSVLRGQVQSFLQLLDLPVNPDQSQVDKSVDQILAEYEELKESIKALTTFYNEQLKVREELAVKMRACELEQHQLWIKFQTQALQSYKISEQQHHNYHERLKKFAIIIKTHFVLLSYLERYFKPPQIINQKRRQSWEQNQNTAAYCSYITELHRMHQLLSENQQSKGLEALASITAKQTNQFYINMLQDVQGWLDAMKNRYNEDQAQTLPRSPYSKPTSYSIDSNQLLPLEYSSSLPPNTPTSHIPPPPEPHSQRAKRIQLLQDVDIDYYKMIKATMKMEKENTRKNYEFLRTFKRAKYASRDDILEEKRFQASFSVLFTSPSPATRPNPMVRTSPIPTIQHPNRSPVLAHTFHSNFISSQTDSQVHASKTIHSSAMSNFKNKQQNRLAITTPKLKAWRESKDRKSRLTQKLREALGYL